MVAPVTADDPVVTWPRAGESPTSTVAPLSPPRPLQLDATIPCETMTALGLRAGPHRALDTLPTDSPQGTYGLQVVVERSTVTVEASDREILSEPIPAGPCSLRITAGESGLRAELGTMVVDEPDLLVPQVAQLVTDAEGLPGVNGMTVSMHTDARYESSPTAIKTVLLVLHGMLLIALAVAAFRAWPGSGRRIPRPRLGLPDLAVLVISAAWMFVAPLNFDDSWYPLMSRGAGESGSISNAIYLFNVTESPFIASQYVMQFWGDLGSWNLMWMRMIPLCYGLVTWVLLRLILAIALEGERIPRFAPWMLLLAHLLWWLPYGTTLRPEPLIAVLAAATFLFTDLARRDHSPALLAGAVATSALAITAAPTGLVAAAPLVLAVPWLLGYLHEQRWEGRVVIAGLLVAAATVVVPVGFADSTPGDLLSAMQARRHYYLDYAWYDEIQHYFTLLVSPLGGGWAKRAPVLLAIAVIILIAIGRNRSTNPPDRVQRLLITSALTFGVSLLLLAFTPTKWVNHFGAIGGIAPLVLTAAFIRSPLPARASAVLRGTGLAVMVVTFGMVFAGPNLWLPYTDRGQFFGDHSKVQGVKADIEAMAPSLLGVHLRSPVVWVLVALAVAWFVRRRTRRVPSEDMTTERGLLVTGSVGAVLLLIFVMFAAPMRGSAGWTVAMSNLDVLRGDRCGLQDHVDVLMPTGPQPVMTTPPTPTGGYATPEDELPVTAPYPNAPVWHDSGSDIETGTFASGWYNLPADTEATHVLVPIATRDLEDKTVELEYRTSARPGAARGVEVSLDDTAIPVDERAAAGWQEAPVAIEDLGDQRPTSIRIVLTDDQTGSRSWLAASEPKLAQWRPVRDLTDGQPVYADQVSSVLWPCVNQVAVSDGMSEPPTVHLLGDEDFARSFTDLGFEIARGGTLANVRATGTTVRTVARLDPEGAELLPWGRVERMVYPHPIGSVDVEVEESTRAPWKRSENIAVPGYSVP